MVMPTSRTFPALLTEITAQHAAQPALVAGEVRLDYEGLTEAVRRCAKGLHALGVRRGDRVAILMGNRAEWIIADFAALSLGATVIAVNTWVTARELAYVLEHSDADTLVFAPIFLKHDYASMLKEIAAEGAALRRITRVVQVDGQPEAGTTSWAELDRLGTNVPVEAIHREGSAVRPTDIAYLLYTSGSTAKPKGVQLQHRGLIENMWEIGERMHVTCSDRLWLAVSLFWGFGCENAVFNVLTHGACLVLQEHFEPAAALKLIEAERCTLLYATSNIAHALVTHPDRPARDLASLRSGGSLGTVEQLRSLVELGAREICNIYGLTEVYGNCNVTDGRSDPPEKRFASVGRALPGFVQRIADPASGRVLPAGEVGEIQMKGHVTPGYYNGAAQDQAAFTEDGFFRTGDLGYLDEEGFLFFRGRLKELIKTGGINVSPAEVEAVLMDEPDVKLALVVGLPDPKREEIIGAVIVPRGEPVDEEALRSRCRRQLSAFKVPQHFRFVAEAELPLTKTGKIHRERLPELFVLEPAPSHADAGEARSLDTSTMARTHA